MLRRSGFDPEALYARGPLYRIRHIEVEEHLAQMDVWLSDEELHDRGSMIAVGEQELFHHLASLGVGPDDLEWPSTVNYPI
jgi:hypothetical protein